MRIATVGLVIMALAATAGAQEPPKQAAPNHNPARQATVTNNPAETIEEYLNPDEPIRVTVGRKFSIRIAANPTTGYSWQLAKPISETVIIPITNSYRQDHSETQRVGVGGHEVWTFKAIGQGAAEISLTYSRPWEKDVPPIRTNVFTVIVK